MTSDQSLRLMITEDGSHTLYNPELNETYHSIKGAISESKHVYIEAGLEFILDRDKPDKLKIFELGFGTGLNAFLTLEHLLKQNTHCTYETVETHPLSSTIYEKLNYFSNDKGALFRELHEAAWDQSVEIKKGFVLSKSAQPLETRGMPPDKTDLIYFDAFAPSKQPGIWLPDNLKKCFSALKPGGVLVTYCAQGQFKRDLVQVGFKIEILPGAMGKKEMVRAVRPD